MTTLTLEARVLGQKKPLVADWPMALSIPARRLRLRELITAIVQEEVRCFVERQEARRLASCLSPAEITQAAARGKVDLGERELRQAVDPEAAIQTALQSFQDGLYFVFVDGAQVRELDGEVVLRSETRITFLRLVALAGG